MAVERWRPFSATVSRWEPFQGIADIQQEMNRLFDSFFGRPTTMTTAERMWIPLCDVYETRDDIHVDVELPGVREKEISLTVTGDVLTVRGERKWDRETSDEGFHRMERVYGKFERSIPLPLPVQTDRVKAVFRDGVLQVKLPKAEEVKPREIKIDIL